jgi:hypothetical protein
VIDEAPQDIGTFKSWRLVLHGTTGSAPPPTKLYFPVLRKAVALRNGNFENGPADWTQFSNQGYNLIETTFSPGVTPHSGAWATWLGGAFNDIQYIEQNATIPAGTPYLRYWHWIASEDGCGYDFGGVLINGTVVDKYNLCAAINTDGWVPHTVDLNDYADQTVAIQIRAETDNDYNSNLFVDDVHFSAEALLVTSTSGGEVWPEAGTMIKSRPETPASEMEAQARRFPTAGSRR